MILVWGEAAFTVGGYEGHPVETLFVEPDGWNAVETVPPKSRYHPPSPDEYPRPMERAFCALLKYNSQRIVKVGRKLELNLATETKFFLGPNDAPSRPWGRHTKTEHGLYHVQGKKKTEIQWSYKICIPKAPKHTTRTYTATYEAAQPFWRSTSIQVTAGDRLRFKATGKVRGSSYRVGADGLWPQKEAGKEYPYPNFPRRALVGRIHDEVFLIGSKSLRFPRSSGPLHLTINQHWDAEYWRNNTEGTFQLTIIRDRPE